MAHATFSFDVDPAAPSAPAILTRVGALAGAHHATRLLTHLWELEFASVAAFDAFAGELEALHAANPAAFDYDAVHYDQANGMVEVAPNPAVRRPHPVPGAGAATPPAAPTLLAGGGVSAAEGPHARNEAVGLEHRSRAHAEGAVRRGGARRGAPGRRGAAGGRRAGGGKRRPGGG